MLSCDVIIWDDNTPLFCFSWKLHSLIREGENERMEHTLTGENGVSVKDRKRRKMNNEIKEDGKIWRGGE